MNRSAFALALAVLALSGCDFELTGLFSGLDMEWVQVGGRVTVGPYGVEEWEAMVLMYDPADTVRAVDSVQVGDGGYLKTFGFAPDPRVCSYVARARLWNGMKTEIMPLFAPRPASCEASEHRYLGADFEFPAYEPLPEPVVVRGRVYHRGEPAAEGELAPRVRLRTDGLRSHAVPLPTDAEGWYRFETTDRATWYSLCRGVSADVGQGSASASAALEGLSFDRCGGERVLPDLRINWPRLTYGRVERVNGGTRMPVGAGEARVVILDPTDSTVVVDTVRTLDDGSFHVWLPYLEWVQGCDLLIRATLTDGPSETRHIMPAGAYCSSDMRNDFAFDPEGASVP